MEGCLWGVFVEGVYGEVFTGGCFWVEWREVFMGRGVYGCVYGRVVYGMGERGEGCLWEGGGREVFLGGRREEGIMGREREGGRCSWRRGGGVYGGVGGWGVWGGVNGGRGVLMEEGCVDGKVSVVYGGGRRGRCSGERWRGV